MLLFWIDLCNHLFAIKSSQVILHLRMDYNSQYVPRVLKQALVDKSLFSIWHRIYYLDLGLAYGQSLFLVEVSLRDDTAWRLLSRGILSEP